MLHNTVLLERQDIENESNFFIPLSSFHFTLTTNFNFKLLLAAQHMKCLK